MEEVRKEWIAGPKPTVGAEGFEPPTLCSQNSFDRYKFYFSSTARRVLVRSIHKATLPR